MLLCNKLNQVVSMLESKLTNDGTTRTRTTQVIPRSLTTDKKSYLFNDRNQTDQNNCFIATSNNGPNTQ